MKGISKHERRVRKLLTNIYEIEERQYSRGDYGAVVTLIDFKEAERLADLTERQREAIRLVYYEGLGQGEAGLKLGISQNTLSFHMNAAIRKIANTYEEWEKLDI